MGTILSILHINLSLSGVNPYGVRLVWNYPGLVYIRLILFKAHLDKYETSAIHLHSSNEVWNALDLIK